MKETNVQNLSLIEASKDKDCMIWRNQCGLFYTRDGRPVNIGIKGTPDSLAVVQMEITPDMVGKKIGVAVGIEFKTLKKGSKQRTDQELWQANFERRSGVYAIVRDPSEVSELIKNIKNGEFVK